ncbi:class I SAM-dependent methyltransferase [Hamadaea tsunoensis]|uniref:class I SAM-dependent methyltransferase n=1 Tax=Hamadaea tsunoensis TaxID=53368 RepID=UPI0003FB193F|nr:class I SAM-dependent methyltransferase [Hamadaea tsunoensis]
MANMGVAEAVKRFIGDAPGVKIEAFDGSSAGDPAGTATVEIRSPRALNYIATGGGSLGLARAFVMGDLDVDGDLYLAMRDLTNMDFTMSARERVQALRALGGLKLLRRPPIPPQEVVLKGRRHSKKRDAEAISHHYDVSNRFYEWILGPSMAYTCAVYPELDASLETAQYTKHDLVARKLGLQPGMRLLDVGCGWGGMVMHAAKHYGVRAIGVTLSRKQAEWAQKAIAENGLSELAEVRFLDYRDVPEGEFDAISSIGLTEHIGRAQYPSYFGFLLERLRVGGRLLNHCITRRDNLDPAIREKEFINRYIFPDGELSGPGYILSAVHDAGFEVRHEENLREHYAMTLRDWSANLEEHWDEAVEEVGLAKARVWKLYLVGSRIGFERNDIQLHQVLGVKLGPDHVSHMPLRPDWGA